MEAIKEAKRVSILNQAITILAERSPELRAPVLYAIRVALPANAGGGTLSVDLPFQRGPVGADGSNINGVSDEALIEILIHRLRAFQSGEAACADNATALVHLERALEALEARSAKRQAAGTDGTTRTSGARG